MSKIEQAIAYFEDAVRESDEIIADCSPELQAALIEQKEHFVVGHAALRAQAEGGMSPALKFDVVDTNTGEYPSLQEIALNEDWAKNLVYCDMEGFAITEDGNLLLLDECGNFAYPPNGRFQTIHRKREGNYS